jgi:hypothetical protein
MNIPRTRHAFATTAMSLVAALAAGTALAISGSGQHDMGAQGESSNDASYQTSQPSDSSGQAMRTAPGQAMSPSDSSDQAPGVSNEDSSDADMSSDTTSIDSSDQASDSSNRLDDQPGASSNDSESSSSTEVNPSTGANSSTQSSRAATGTIDSTRPIAYSSETTVVTYPQHDTVVVTRSDEPRYVPETGDAQYGSKLTPENRLAPGEVEPPARFNDATGQ